MKAPPALIILTAWIAAWHPGQSSAQEIPPFVKVPSPEGFSAATTYKPVQLKQISDKPNQITDEEKWWAENQLESPFLSVPNPFGNQAGDLPAAIPPRAGGDMVVRASLNGGQPFAIYGKNFAEGAKVLLFQADLSKIAHALDFSDWLKPPYRIIWVQVRGEVMYFSYGINGYASNVDGKTAYLAAINLKDQTVLWRSEPLVANARNFILIGDSIVSGYGFTAEPDFLLVINSFNGKTVKKIKVATGPDYLILKEGRLYVRCYNRDYVFEVTP